MLVGSSLVQVDVWWAYVGRLNINSRFASLQTLLSWCYNCIGVFIAIVSGSCYSCVLLDCKTRAMNGNQVFRTCSNVSLSDYTTPIKSNLTDTLNFHNPVT